MKALHTTWIVIALCSLVATASATSGRKHHRQHHKSSTASTSRAGQGLESSGTGMVGTWTLRNGDKPRTDIKMIFKDNGTFAFRGPNWNSAGKFTVADHTLKLVWTAVDGESVKPGAMHKDFAMGDGDTSFRIDQYTYYKLGAAGPSAERVGSKN